MTRSHLSAMAALAAILLFTACSGNSEQADQNTQQTSIPVSIKELSESKFVEYGEYFGRTEPVAAALLTAPSGGQVQAVHASEGDWVEAGASLGSIALDRVSAAYETALLNERIARDVYENQERFYKAGNVSRLVMDQAELAWRSAQNTRLEAERSLVGARCETPITGFVLSRKIELHDELPPGGISFSVGDLSSLIIRVGINESDMSFIRQGSEVQISSSAYPGEEWMGRIERLEREPNDHSLTYTAVVGMENPDFRLLPGLTAKVIIPRRSLEKAIVVPTEAILSGNRGSYALIARREGEGWVARSIPVERGISSDMGTLILSGLMAGDALILEGNHLIKDGTPIYFTETLALASEAAGSSINR